MTIDVGNEKTEQRIKNVAAGYDGVLITEIKGEREDGPQIERKGRKAQEDIDSGGGDNGGDPAEDEVAEMKMGGNPEDEIPERWVAFVAKAMQEELGQTEIASEKPSLRFVVPRFMPGNGAREHDEINHPYREIPELPTQHEDEFSR